MAFDLDRFASLRPYSYHLTSANNLSSLRACMFLETAAGLAKVTGRPDAVSKPRKEQVLLQARGGAVALQSQSPLHAGNISLEGGWTFEHLVERLNSLVFFWPGGPQGPINYGERHYHSKSWPESPMVLRVSTSELVRENSSVTPLFCRFNSGSPRWSNGKPSPRGPKTFLPADQFSGSISDVVELTFPGRVRLPKSVEIGDIPLGPWRNFAASFQRRCL
jgi:hypothetical protein